MEPWFWTVIFLGLGFLFIFLEFFITSGGILAFLAAVSLLASVFFAFLNGPAFGGSYTLGVVGGVAVLCWYFFKYWPQSAMGRRMLLNPEDDPALAPDEELLALKGLVGKRGIARSKMLLSGQIEIGGKRINAVSESESLEPGEAVVVVNVDGINVLVRKAADVPASAPEPAKTSEQTVDDPFA